MKISPININYKPCTSVQINGRAKALNADDFAMSSGLQKNDVAFTSIKKVVTGYFDDKISKAILSHHDKFTPDVFMCFSDFEKNILTRTYNKMAKANGANLALSATLDVSKLLKTGLDKKYGEGNYVFVSIGRSLETFKEALSYMGVDAKALPISGLHDFDGTIDDIVLQKGFDNYLAALKKLGLDSKTISDSSKQYIFSDYCWTGNTLEVVEKMLKSDKVGIKSDNVCFVDFADLYNKMLEITKRKPQTTPSVLNLHFGYQFFKNFSTTPRLRYDELANVSEALNLPQSNEAKLFNFALMKKLWDKKG